MNETAPVVVVAHFELADACEQNADAFEKAFAQYWDYCADQDGFLRALLLRSPDSLGSQVILTEWRDALAYKAAVSSPAFYVCAGAELLDLADLDNDHGKVLAAAGGGGQDGGGGGQDAGGGGQDGGGGGPRCVLTTYTLREGAAAGELERALGAELGDVARQPGFSRGSVIASARRAGRYTAVVRTEDAARAVARLSAARADADHVTRVYDVIAQSPAPAAENGTAAR
ncbi:antibiotic biosynthesis monooxygenase family protein [Streptomyces sp. NPDC097640]|uniref:antibiotic biosynthesis monooxygenase family protein n=1 Tax=Streptomyces sp. NPDC097640 TaxID=3157229 RepID=UPI00332C2B0A